MKIRIKLQKRFSLENIMMTMALFFVASYALLEHVSLSIPLFSVVKTPIIYMGAAFILPYLFKILGNLRKKKFFFLFLMTLLLFALMGLSAYFNRNTTYGYSPARITLRFIMFWLEVFLLMVWIAETGRGDFTIRFLFGYVLTLVVLTDFLLLTKLITFRNGSHVTYLVGNKFSVAYLHMDLLTLWFVKNNGKFHFWQKSKILVILVACIFLGVSLYIDCITGFIGCAVLMWLFASLDTPVQKKLFRLNSPKLLMLFLMASLIFPFVSQSLVSLPPVQAFLEDVLGRTTTLTGRINIFEFFVKEMDGYWLWGYGYGNSSAIAHAIFGYANAQNAILDWIMQAGVLVTGTLVGMILLIFKQLSQESETEEIMPLVALIYAYIIMGAVETTFNMTFLLWLAVLFMQINETQITMDEEEE